MPQVRKLTAEEAHALKTKPKSQRVLIEEEYDTLLGEMEQGDYGVATLEDGEKRITVRNRLRAAAQRRQLEVVFTRTKGNLIRFQLVAGRSARPAPRRHRAASK